jgi:hypothetical protein
MADALSTTLDDQVDDGTVVTEFTVVNEFAAVRVRKLLTRNGERLRVDSLRLGYRNRLDALALDPDQACGGVSIRGLDRERPYLAGVCGALGCRSLRQERPFG